MGASPRILLASASLRRRALLSAAGVAFEVRPAEVDEALPPGLGPEDAAVVLAKRKARAVAAGVARRPVWVLAADTIVAVDRPEGTHILGKPQDAAHARRMLAWLAGTRHRVITGVCALRAADGAAATGFERTYVTMRPIDEREIEAYVDSQEWRDKAGGYAIQESADRFVTRLEEGGLDNVVGLPVALALRLLASLGAEL